MQLDSTRILVVDDNPASRYATSHILRSARWEVVEAASGAQGLSLLDDGVDLIVLDVNLPDIDGFEVCRRIRLDTRHARTPVIHISATFVKDTDRVHGLESGADGYLVHPVEPPVLLATVRAFLRARRAELDRERLLRSERAARAEAERANEIKDEFLAVLSHELRTPLHAIIGWTEVLKLGTISQEEVRKGIQTIERNARVQEQMIADLLDVSRIAAGKLTLEIQPVDLAATLEAALSAIVPAAHAKGIHIQWRVDAASPTVNGDASRLQQILWNLISNAVKFTPANGRIDVALERRESVLQLTVADSGRGIHPEFLPRIFERFYQGDASTTRDHGGLGLGLAIVKQLVELHGGKIVAESAGEGLGSRFTVTLPATAAPAAPEERPAGDPAPAAAAAAGPDERLKHARVLVVDDDTDAREVLLLILKSYGAEAQGAASVPEALALLPAFKPHVLVSDVGMPGHDGFELIRRVRAQGYTPDKLAAVALTGFASLDDRHRALDAGFQDHLAKPVNTADLAAKIADLLRTCKK